MSNSHQANSGSAAMSDTVHVPALPDCEIHENELGRPGVPAEFDGKTTSGSWARMCVPCFFNYGEGLGTGRGQRLVVRAPRGEGSAPTCAPPLPMSGDQAMPRHFPPEKEAGR